LTELVNKLEVEAAKHKSAKLRIAAGVISARLISRRMKRAGCKRKLSKPWPTSARRAVPARACARELTAWRIRLAFASRVGMPA
jgi:hypothetical protein